MLLRQDGAVIDAGSQVWPFGTSDRHHLMRRIRAIRRALMILLWTLPCMPVQAVLLMPARARQGGVRAALLGDVGRLLGLRVRVIGEPAARRWPAGGVRLQPFVLARCSGARRPAGRLLRLQGRGRLLAGGQHHRPAGPHGLRQPPARRNGQRARRHARPARRRRQPVPVPRGHHARTARGCCRSARPSSPSPRATSRR